MKIMKEPPTHQGCPYRHTCKKDEKQCCYLLSNRNCYLNTEKSKEFI